MKRVMILSVFFILIFSILSVNIYAKSGNGNDGDDEEKEKFRFEKIEKFIDENGNTKIIKSKLIIEGGEIKKKIKIESENKKYEVETELEIEEDEINEKFKVKTSSGAKKLISVLPDDVYKIAMEKLGSEKLDINLNEADGKIVYEAETEKDGKIFGIIKKKVKIKAVIDSETGEVLRVKKKWWSFFVIGENNIQLGDKVLICHLPPGNISNEKTLTIGSPAVKAHLAHGDYLGECKVDSNGNQTTSENLFLNIISPQNITYNEGEILINIESNGSFIWFSINNGENENYTSEINKTFLEGNYTLRAFSSLGNETEDDEVDFFVVSIVPDVDINNTDGNSSEINSSV